VLESFFVEKDMVLVGADGTTASEMLDGGTGPADGRPISDSKKHGSPGPGSTTLIRPSAAEVLDAGVLDAGCWMLGGEQARAGGGGACWSGVVPCSPVAPVGLSMNS
jgi:hypothetical protein